MGSEKTKSSGGCNSASFKDYLSVFGELASLRSSENQQGVRHMYCIERDSGTCYRGQDRLYQKDNANHLFRAGNYLNVARARQYPAKSDNAKSQEDGVELYVQIPTHPYRHTEILMATLKDPFLRRLTH
jgi:hypothetical protein